MGWNNYIFNNLINIRNGCCNRVLFILKIMIQTNTAIKRTKRDTKIQTLYSTYMAIDGSMKFAVYEKVAKEVGVSVSTVGRVINKTA